MSAQPRVTVYWYSQTGQLLEAVSAVTDPLEKAGWDIRKVEIRPRQAFPFPWPLRRFFGVFPASVDPDGAPGITARPPVAEDDDADLVVFAFPVWYLAPALPMRALAGERPKAFDGRAVVGLVACRNMWYSAAIEVRRLIQAAGGRYLGTISAVDTASAAITFVTTLRWLLAGKREASWGFPRAGVGTDELDRLALLGERLAELAPPPAGPVPAQTELAPQPAVPAPPPAGPAPAQTELAPVRPGLALASTGPAPERTELSPDRPDPASRADSEETLADRVRDVLAAHDAAPVHAPLAAADLLAGKAFRVWGRAIRAAGRPGEVRRTALTWVFVLWLTGAILAGLPTVVVARVLFKAGFDAAVARRLAPVVARLGEVRR
ncbi:hypothetical protein [Streptomyces sp. JB150]|uniref:hypothetical protein n=1 Tax=Streptomyces sp. JB150 TaxID=2714844 RepID=UPI001407715F|nr:hypothetical protein [Streptomyces sp. JB150]QIJ60735.1 hypothetical protein G7Z13_00805 [Streptomyces sp. JB150]